MRLLTRSTFPENASWRIRADLHLSHERPFVLDQVESEASGSLALHANPKMQLHSAENYTRSGLVKVFITFSG